MNMHEIASRFYITMLREIPSLLGFRFHNGPWTREAYQRRTGRERMDEVSIIFILAISSLRWADVITRERLWR